MLPSEFTTERLTLRAFQPHDAQAVFEYWLSDPNWPRFNASVPDNFTQTDAIQFTQRMIERDRADQPNWAIIHDARVVGVVSLSFEHAHHIAVLGYGIHSRLRGRGVAAEAARKVINLAFTTIHQLQKIRAHTDAQNTPSISVLQKLGFTQEGLLRQNQLVSGELRDEAIFGLLRGEWQPI